MELKLWPELVFRQQLHTIWLIRLRRRPLMKSDEMCPMAFTVIVILVSISNGGRIFDGIFFRKCLQMFFFERRVGITDCPTKIYLTKDCSNWIVIKDRQPKFVFKESLLGKSSKKVFLRKSSKAIFQRKSCTEAFLSSPKVLRKGLLNSFFSVGLQPAHHVELATLFWFLGVPVCWCKRCLEQILDGLWCCHEKLLNLDCHQRLFTQKLCCKHVF